MYVVLIYNEDAERSEHHPVPLFNREEEAETWARDTIVAIMVSWDSDGWEISEDGLCIRDAKFPEERKDLARAEVIEVEDKR